jgi:hypothetical protein
MTVPIGARLRQNASAMKTESEVGTKNVDTEFRIQNLEVAGSLGFGLASKFTLREWWVCFR